MQRLLLLFATLVCYPAFAAEDIVIAKPKQGRGTIRITGEVTDYTGQQLTIRRVGNREEIIESPRIIDVQTSLTLAHRTADEQLAQEKFAEALASYQAALTEERRPWVRRRILADSISCLRATDRIESAMDVFLQLYRDDPTTDYFDRMPISWLADSPSPGVIRKAQALISDKDSPVARLMGASWQLPTSQRSLAISALQGLLAAEDARVAFWSEAQLWRVQLVSADAETVARWQTRWSKMPVEIQVGPAFVLGQAYSRLGRSDEAALLFLRAPILKATDGELAAQALLAAAKEFETMKRIDQAADLYREILDKYAKSSAASIAQQQLAALKQ